MEISTYALLGYALIWTVFYWFLSQFIAQLSRDKWVEYVKSEESDDVLVEALQAVIEEIEDRMHDKLEDFKASFFGSLGAASKKLDQATGQGAIKALTKDNPVMGFLADYMMKRGGLDALQGQNTPNNDTQKPNRSGKLGLK